MKRPQPGTVRGFTLLCAALLLAAAISTPLWALPDPNAFDATISGWVTPSDDGAIYHFDAGLNDPNLFGAFFIFLDPTALLGLSPADLESPEGWDRSGVYADKGYVAFQTKSMSPKDVVSYQDGFGVRIPDLSGVLGYGFHVRESGTRTTYFATLVPEPGTLVLLSSGLLLLTRYRRR